MVNGPGSARRLLGVFAHPDDEVFCAGGTIARAADAGAEIMIVSATPVNKGRFETRQPPTVELSARSDDRELWAAAAELGAHHAQVLAYPDGNLQHHRFSLGDAIAEIMRQFDPDTVVTFGPDGGYGHPDHVAVSELTTATFRGLVRHRNRGQRLYHAVFPPRRTSMAEELAHWVTNSGKRATDRAALQAITLFASESTTMRLISGRRASGMVSPWDRRDRTGRARGRVVPDPQRDRGRSSRTSRRPGDPTAADGGRRILRRAESGRK